MELTQKLSHKMASVVVISLLATIFAFAMVFGGIMAAYYLTDLTGSLVKGFGYVAAFFLGLLFSNSLYSVKNWLLWWWMPSLKIYLSNAPLYPTSY
jgi:hypothetical protein